MKKFLFAMPVLSIAIAATVVLTQNDKPKMSELVEANAEALADLPCPNGCVSGKGGCICHENYPQYREAQHRN